ncbi:tryptophan synthase alpha chain [Methanococcus voltae]|uniref:tryptophan synthase n=1 Tax=Methanococcus voltae TaxID=2188 RepID=A0A8J7RNS8_METVO|nr:tryptophan synthase subunit alpha [Methanococcus voltae]MBP2201544.1 tryptophan synthase alpha chain [Methanococcus voltae]
MESIQITKKESEKPELKSKEVCEYYYSYVLGYPNIKESAKLLNNLINSETGEKNVNFVLKIPFSDPGAETDAEKYLCEEALKNGFEVKKMFDELKNIDFSNKNKTVLYTYYNIAYVKGLDNFIKTIKEMGFTHIHIPDIPYKESEELLNICEKYGLKPILAISPNLDESKIKIINDKVKSIDGMLLLNLTTGNMMDIFNTEIMASHMKNISNICDCETIVNCMFESELVDKSHEYFEGTLVSDNLAILLKEYGSEEKIELKIMDYLLKK